MAQDPPDRLDPACVDDVYEATIVNQVFDGLLSFDAHLNTVPCVASSWVLSPDGMVYTFHLKKGVRFHDGTDLTSSDVVYSLTRVFDLPPEQASLAQGYLCHIRGAEAYQRREATSIQGLEALAPHVVRITLSSPYSPFLAVLASELGRIVPEHYVRSVGSETFARAPIGSGPFRFVRWVPGDRIVLARFSSYGQGLALLDSLVFELPESNSRDYAAEGVLAGRMSAAVVPDGRLRDFVHRPGVALLTRQELSLTFLALNAQIEPFDDPRVRQAFALAIDRDAIIAADPGGRIPPNGILPPGMPGYTPESKLLPHDLERARLLLAEAGHPGGQGLPPVVYTIATQTQQARTIFQAIRNQVAQAGFDLQLRELGWREFSQLLTGQELQVCNITWVADVPDPDSFLHPLAHSAGSANFAAYTSGLVDALLTRGRSNRSALDRLAVYREAERCILQDAPIVPLFHPLSAIALRENVRGLHVTAMGVGNLALEKVWMAPPAKGRAELAGPSTVPETAAPPTPVLLQGRMP